MFDCDVLDEKLSEELVEELDEELGEGAGLDKFPPPHTQHASFTDVYSPSTELSNVPNSSPNSVQVFGIS